MVEDWKHGISNWFLCGFRLAEMSRGHVFLSCFVCCFLFCLLFFVLFVVFFLFCFVCCFFFILFVVFFPKQFPESVWKAIVQCSPPPSSLPSHPPPSLFTVYLCTHPWCSVLGYFKRPYIEVCYTQKQIECWTCVCKDTGSKKKIKY